MKRKVVLLPVLFFALSVFCGCGASDKAIRNVPDYSDAAAWFLPQEQERQMPADLFYIAPTCVWDWQDSTGKVQHHMDIYNEEQRTQVASALYLGKGVFGDSCNFFAPFYRQITMNSWIEGDSVIEARYPLAQSDIDRAFDYYMEHLNGGRPFVLAGHSQGGRAVLELLKHKLDSARASKLVAAYIVGYVVTQEDTVRYPYLRMAKDSVDTGVAICFNSVADTGAVSPLLTRNQMCINPLNWRTDAVEADKTQNLGAVFLNPDGTVSREIPCFTGACIDTLKHVLVLPEPPPSAYFIPVIASLFPEGNYHVQELNFYYRNLQKNVSDRIRAYRATRR